VECGGKRSATPLSTVKNALRVNAFLFSKAASRPPQSKTTSVFLRRQNPRQRRGVRRQAERDAAFRDEGMFEDERLPVFKSGVTATAVQDGKWFSGMKNKKPLPVLPEGAKGSN
jgi:hypothetical protein